jgi:hypothetical protein
MAAAASVLALPAMAQTATKPAVRASLNAPASWACAGALIEIAPVSFDVAGRADEWVLVHRVKGEVVASERLSQDEAEQVKRLPCGRTTQPKTLVG